MQPSRQRAPFPARPSYIDLNDASSSGNGEGGVANGIYKYGEMANGLGGNGGGSGASGGGGGGGSGGGGFQGANGGAIGGGTGVGAGKRIWGLTREDADVNENGNILGNGLGHDNGTTGARTHRDPRGTPEYSGAWLSLPDFPSRRGSLMPLRQPHPEQRGGPGYRPPSPIIPPSLLASLPFPLPSTSTIRFVLLCALWYSTSALSSNTGKVILNNFRFPVTLTIVQFFFVAGYCWLTSRRWLGWLTRGARTRLRHPTRKILVNTLPMAVFQVGGHIFSSMAISRVPVSTVHTIKALSPLFTVGAYALLFRVSYTFATYLSLLPLTLGVMLACSFDMSSSNAFGLVCAFGSTLVFVSSNIVFKKLMPSTPGSTASGPDGGRLDKINLLFFSSGMAFLLMIPIWLSSDVPTLLSMWFNPTATTRQPVRVGSATTLSVMIYFFLNGTVHFAQNYLAFAILSSTSPVTYSIASLVKRIAVICLAILWFNQSVHPVQALGIGLTGIGLYMYNNAKRDVERGEKKVRHIEAVRDGILPLNKVDQRLLESSREGSPDIEASGKGGVHASPKPTYMDQTPLSISTAVRGNGFSLPPPSFPLAIPSTIDHLGTNSPHPQVTMSMSISDPYPSPPPSNASSPPFHSVSVPLNLESATASMTTTSYHTGKAPARRRLSNDSSHLPQPLTKPAAAGALHQHLPLVSALPPAATATS